MRGGARKNKKLRPRAEKTRPPPPGGPPPPPPSPVGQCMVVGDGRRYVAALVTLDPEAVAHWLAVRELPPDAPTARLREHPELVAAVQRAVDHANEAVSQAEAIRRFRIVEGEFTEENGLLTPSLKVRRAAVAEAYAHEIEALYDEER